MATWASDGSVANVQALHNQAQTVDGDTITMPAGTFTWAAQLTITKKITLQGAGIDVTTILDNLTPKGGVPGVLIIVTTTDAPTPIPNYRVTGFTIQGQATDTTGNNVGCFHVDGSSHSIRLDNLKFFHPSTGLFTNGYTWGVIDHCQFYTETSPQGSATIPLTISHQNWPAAVGSQDFGDGSFYAPTNLGSGQGITVEDCYFLANGAGGVGVGDTDGGGRYTIRHCIIENQNWGVHGTEAAFRSVRQFEIYQNEFKNTIPAPHLIPKGATIRGGTGVIWGNWWHSVGVSGATGFAECMSFQTYRDFQSGGAFSPAPSGWDAPDPRIDQCGWGQCLDALDRSGTTPINHRTGGIAWPTQQSEPIYVWNNTYNTVPNNTGPFINTGEGPTLTVYGPSSPAPNTSRDVKDNGNCINPAGGGTPPYGGCTSGTAKPGYVPFTYPHPLVSGATTGKIIFLSGNMAFGNVTIGSSGTATLNVANQGNTLLTVTAVSYPAGFSGPVGGFTVSPNSSVNLTVTFTPLVAQAYSGNIVVTSDATSGNGTIAATGTGISGVYPLAPSSDGRYYVDKNNNPFLIIGDAPHSILANANNADVTNYMQQRGAQGYNALWIELGMDAHIFATGNEGTANYGHDINGNNPFTTYLPGTLYDLTTPNEPYWAHVDFVAQQAAAYGLQCVFTPLDNYGWVNTFLANGPTRCNTYGQFLGNRYLNYKNVIWNLGNDFQTWRTAANDAAVLAIADGIKSVNSNLLTIELDFYFSDSQTDPNWVSRITANGIYTYYITYDETYLGYNRPTIKPVLFLEEHYEGETVLGVLGTPTVLRRQFYWSMLAGAKAGFMSGNFYTVRFASGWQNNLSTPCTTQLIYFKNFFQSRQYYNLVPDQSNTMLTGGFGSYGTPNVTLVPNSDYAVGAVTPDKTLGVIYTPVAHTLVVNMASFAGNTTTRWYDPTNNTFTAIAGSPFPNSGSRNFTTPGNNSSGDPDWILLMESATTPPPGTHKKMLRRRT